MINKDNNLSSEHCVACKGGVDPLTENEAKAMLANVPGWSLVAGGRKIMRRFTTKNWASALKIVQATSPIAEAEKHHPDIHFGWGYCEVELQTHTINGLHKNDFIVAAKINQAVEKL